MEFLYVINIAARRMYYTNLDQKLDRMLSVLRRGGTSGRQIQAQLAQMDSVVVCLHLNFEQIFAIFCFFAIFLQLSRLDLTNYIML